MIIDELFEAPQQCPECGGISFSDLILAEKKDACYHKVKASAKVWPSAYASGRLVQCRKKGAANYGKSKTESVAEGKVKLYTDPSYFGAEVDDTGFDSLPVVNIPTNRLVGFEPDSKMQQPKAMANVKNILAGLEQGDNIPPILVRKYKNGYQVLDGHHRFWAYKVAKKDTIPARVVDPKDIEEVGKQGMAEQQELDEKWSQKYKKSINCANPKGFSQRAHCAGRKKNEDVAELDEGGDVFMPNIKDTPEYRAGLATGKLPVPYPEGTQQYASYYKGVIDRASPTLAKVGEGEQQPGADYRDPPEADYDDEYDAMVARVKKLAGLGPMKTVYDPTKRVYRNQPTAVQPPRQSKK